MCRILEISKKYPKNSTNWKQVLMLRERSSLNCELLYGQSFWSKEVNRNTPGWEISLGILSSDQTSPFITNYLNLEFFFHLEIIVFISCEEKARQTSWHYDVYEVISAMPRLKSPFIRMMDYENIKICDILWGVPSVSKQAHTMQLSQSNRTMASNTIY